MSVDLKEYREQDSEKLRTLDLTAMLPRGEEAILDIGTRDGHFAKLFTKWYPRVVALDLERPSWAFHGVETVQGDVTNLDFPDKSFDVVFCAEVLEHIPALEKACQELKRVSRKAVLVGVPYRQDTRVGQTICACCNGLNPPWGHINTFDENRLDRLFSGWRREKTSFVGQRTHRTNALAAWLMTKGGNPWGMYDQDEPCIHCGAKLKRPAERSFLQKVFSHLAARLERWESSRHAPTGAWIHCLFVRDE